MYRQLLPTHPTLFGTPHTLRQALEAALRSPGVRLLPSFALLARVLEDLRDRLSHFAAQRSLRCVWHFPNPSTCQTFEKLENQNPKSLLYACSRA
eukprot:299342-Chlamydomonas_euryale.AAC.2